MATCIGEEENLCGNVRHLVNGLEVQIIHLTLRTSWILQLRGYFSGRVRHTRRNDWFEGRRFYCTHSSLVIGGMLCPGRATRRSTTVRSVGRGELRAGAFSVVFWEGMGKIRQAS